MSESCNQNRIAVCVECGKGLVVGDYFPSAFCLCADCSAKRDRTNYGRDFVTQQTLSGIIDRLQSMADFAYDCLRPRIDHMAKLDALWRMIGAEIQRIRALQYPAPPAAEKEK
jgi:hypothetical protein